MGGASTIQGALTGDLVDELRIHLAPVVLGGGTALFARGFALSMRQMHVRVSGQATHLTYQLR
ncbi:dihydrofolate reductase family protein [Actinoplanes sp. NPDC051861]|uniref:dihydrofolate reductase family protein n=1 Tax=Actinoplanes sp. NPDC051861 TaxID=3155170 RepID=UPI00343F7128